MHYALQDPFYTLITFIKEKIEVIEAKNWGSVGIMKKNWYRKKKVDIEKKSWCREKKSWYRKKKLVSENKNWYRKKSWCQKKKLVSEKKVGNKK